MVENLVVLGLGIIIGLLGTLAFKWWQEEQAWYRAQSRKRIAARMYDQATEVLQTTAEMLAVAEAEQRRAEAISMPTRPLRTVAESWRTRWSQWREGMRGEPSTPDWKPGEVLAMAGGTGTITPDPPPPPPPPKARTQPWDRHLDRSLWPKPAAEPARVVTQVSSRIGSDQTFTIVLPRELVSA